MDGWIIFFYDKSISSPIPKKISPLGRNSNIGVSNTWNNESMHVLKPDDIVKKQVDGFCDSDDVDVDVD